MFLKLISNSQKYIFLEIAFTLLLRIDLCPWWKLTIFYKILIIKILKDFHNWKKSCHCLNSVYQTCSSVKLVAIFPNYTNSYSIIINQFWFYYLWNRMGLFGHTKVDPKKKVNEMSGLLRKWYLNRNLKKPFIPNLCIFGSIYFYILSRRESRQIDRQIQTIEREQNKTKMEIKKAAKAGNKEVCKILAKEIINANKAKSKLYQSKAHMNSVMVTFNNELWLLKWKLS